MTAPPAKSASPTSAAPSANISTHSHSHDRRGDQKGDRRGAGSGDRRGSADGPGGDDANDGLQSGLDESLGDGLEVISIAKSYDKRAVLTDISVSVAKGEVLGLLGPNGAGKTTCFYSIMGLVRPDAGRILMDGEDVTHMPMYRRAILGLGYLPQETSIFRGMTVEQNINCVLEMVEPDGEVRAKELERLLEEFGLTRLRASPAMALSGGERRRCEIARALAAKPSIMLLDEPFAGIDPLSISDIRDLVKDLKTRGIGVLITDHNVRETLEIVDRACIIYGGQVLFSGTPQDLVEDENVRRLYLGEGFTL